VSKTCGFSENSETVVEDELPVGVGTQDRTTPRKYGDCLDLTKLRKVIPCILLSPFLGMSSNKRNKEPVFSENNGDKFKSAGKSHLTWSTVGS